MQPLEEKDNLPLEDNEISRLIKVSRELGYKKQDKILGRNLIDFKPTSISEMAIISDQEKKPQVEIKSTHNINSTKEEPQNEGTEDVTKSSSDDMSSTHDSDVLEEHTTESKNNDDIKADTDQVALTDDIEIPDTHKQEQTTSSEASAPNLQENLADKPTNLREQETNFEKTEIAPLERAKQEGIEMGKELALKNLENKQKDLVDAFELLIENIKKKEELDKSALTQSILKAITELASERAGSEIKEHSEPFKNKITSFVNKIEQASKKLTLNLNPKDAGLLKETLNRSLYDKNVEIVENSELFHGDFILQMGTVEIGDLISEQITVHERQDDKVLRSDKLEEDKEVADSEASIPLESPLPQDDKKQKKTRNKDQDE